MNQQLTHKVLLSLDREQWRRVQSIVVAGNEYRSGADLIRDAIERRLREIEALGPTFEQAWRMSHSGNPPSEAEKSFCYRRGPLLHGVGELFARELKEHYFAGRWDERTAELLVAQIAECKRRGFRLPPAPMDPPGLDGLQPREAFTVSRVTDSDESENIV